MLRWIWVCTHFLFNSYEDTQLREDLTRLCAQVKAGWRWIEEGRKGGAENPARVPRYAWNLRWYSSPLGFPGDTNGKEPACQCRRHKRCRINPWVGKIPWRRAWQPTPVFLPGRSHGQRSLAGYSPWSQTWLSMLYLFMDTWTTCIRFYLSH